MRIGPHEIGPGAALAPMAGVTNPPFRQLCAELGAVLTVGELVSCHAVLALSKRERARARNQRLKTKALLTRYDGERPFAVQLCGRDPEPMAEAARIAVDAGADIVDLNFGCPARKIVKSGQGAGVALMRDLPQLAAVAARVVAAVEVPVSAKMRLGWSAEERNAVDVALALEQAGVQAICVHARTREQVHSGPVNLDALAQVCGAVTIPVIGNGGIRGSFDAREMIERTGCERVAIGQAARGNPWIFSAILGGPDAPDLAGRIALCRRHLELYVDFAGEQRAAIEMRKHACWYLKGFPGAAAFRKRLAQAVNAESFSRLLSELPGA
jgi:tRNA-dihydrouridine synthase B